MKQHFRQGEPEEQIKISKSFSIFESFYAPMSDEEKLYNFRDEIQNKLLIKTMYFGGFKKCIYPVQKFDSDTERLFSMILEDAQIVQKWFRPTDKIAKYINILYKLYGESRLYYPDFVVESNNAKYLVELKRAKEVLTEEVQSKKSAAVKWCKYATEYTKGADEKSWIYVLIPHDEITQSTSFEGLVNRFQTGG